jgi:hypothetical protein
MTVGLGRRGHHSCAKIHALEADQTNTSQFEAFDNLLFAQIDLRSLLDDRIINSIIVAGAPTETSRKRKVKKGQGNLLARHPKRSRRIAGLEPGFQPPR